MRAFWLLGKRLFAGRRNLQSVEGGNEVVNLPKNDKKTYRGHRGESLVNFRNFGLDVVVGLSFLSRRSKQTIEAGDEDEGAEKKALEMRSALWARRWAGEVLETGPE